MREVAAEINEALKAWEKDPEINAPIEGRGMVTRPFYKPYCGASGTRVFICYVLFQGGISISRSEAETYLAWIREGNFGRHYAALREASS